MQKVLGKKLNMSQIFLEDGNVKPVTWVKIESKDTDFKDDMVVEVISKSKGKGFTGAIKRWGFKKQPVTHGASDRTRAPGSIGTASSPSRVLKGKKMAGKHGNKKITLKRRKLLKVDNDKVAISGPLPGGRGTKVIIKYES